MCLIKRETFDINEDRAVHWTWTVSHSLIFLLFFFIPAAFIFRGNREFQLHASLRSFFHSLHFRENVCQQRIKKFEINKLKRYQKTKRKIKKDNKVKF